MIGLQSWNLSPKTNILASRLIFGPCGWNLDLKAVGIGLRLRGCGNDGSWRRKFLLLPKHRLLLLYFCTVMHRLSAPSKPLPKSASTLAWPVPESTLEHCSVPLRNEHSGWLRASAVRLRRSSIKSASRPLSTILRNRTRGGGETSIISSSSRANLLSHYILGRAEVGVFFTGSLFFFFLCSDIVSKLLLSFCFFYFLSFSISFCLSPSLCVCTNLSVFLFSVS